MTSSGVSISVRDSVVWVTLQRPEKRNAITAEMWDSINDALTDLGRRAEIRALAIQGSGGSFTAGADLASVRDADGNLSVDYHKKAFQALATIRQFPRPTLALIDGPCIGGGCSIALSCDVRFATPESIFAVPGVSLGIVYEEWAVGRLIDLMGSSRTSRFLLTGRRVTGTEAESMGLIDLCTESLAEEGAAYLHALCSGDSVAITETRKTIRRLAGPAAERPLIIEEVNP